MTGIFDDDDDDLVRISSAAILQYRHEPTLCQRPIPVIIVDSYVKACIPGHLRAGRN